MKPLGYILKKHAKKTRRNRNAKVREIEMGLRDTVCV